MLQALFVTKQTGSRSLQLRGVAGLGALNIERNCNNEKRDSKGHKQSKGVSDKMEGGCVDTTALGCR